MRPIKIRANLPGTSLGEDSESNMQDDHQEQTMHVLLSSLTGNVATDLGRLLLGPLGHAQGTGYTN